ncbi:deoxyguanosinetriphosphate triphosphohydrolase [Eubacteriales bacterium KG127]
MILREDIEKRELEHLSEHGAKARYTKGRAIYEEPCKYRTEYQRDRDRIIHSKAFRRLMHKTQVFLSPEGDHYRTRLTHTLEVAQISRTISCILGLNEDLTEAIAMGHDLGHTPFGHNGEMVLNRIHSGGFKHSIQSLRVVERIETRSSLKGMNLTWEVKDGIVNHTGSSRAATLEGQVVNVSDRIAYINHDIDDAIRSGVLTFDMLPKGPISLFGKRRSQRITKMIESVVAGSENRERISMIPKDWEMLLELRQFMFRNVYTNADVKKRDELDQAEKIVEFLYNYYIKNEQDLPKEMKEIAKEEGVHVAAKDYVAGMTDRFAINKYKELK